MLLQFGLFYLSKAAQREDASPRRCVLHAILFCIEERLTDMTVAGRRIKSQSATERNRGWVSLLI